MKDDACWACKIEAEIGTEENPHPIPERFHACELLAAAATRTALTPSVNRYGLAPGPDGTPGDQAREFLRLLATLGDERFVGQEIHALVMFWMREDVFTEKQADEVTQFLGALASRQLVGPKAKGKAIYYACEVCGDNISPDEGNFGKRCLSCESEPQKTSGLL
jgi:hypothetical protein